VSILPREGAWFVFRRCGPAGPFWIQTDWGKRYHVMELHEALLLWAPLLALYFILDFADRPNRSPAKPSEVGA